MTTREFAELLQSLPCPDPRQGFFGPRSHVWAVIREAALHIAGPRALLMQIAHPLVAQGVADHSDFRGDPYGRALRTFSAVYAIVFGTRDQAIKAATRVHAVHQRVEGVLAEDAGRHRAGEPYRANMPHLLRWVHATLVESSLVTYERFVSPLADRGEACYREMREGAPLFGLATDALPRSCAEFRSWVAETIDSDEIAVTSTARELAESLLRGPPGLTWLSPAVRAVAAGLLPEKLRDGFGLRWRRRTRLASRLITGAARVTVPRVPRSLRAVPMALAAELRCRGEPATA